MTALIYLLAFVFGASIGSFLNVCIYRLPREGMSIRSPKRSLCFACGEDIAWYDNIPIFSYFFLRGRCRHCGAPFSSRYALIEILTGFLFVLTVWRFQPENFSPGEILPIPIYLALVSALVVATFVDIDHFIIPDEISIPGMVVAAAAGLVVPWVFPDTSLLPAVMGGKTVGIVGALWSYPHLVPPGVINSLLGGLFGGGVLWAIGVAGTALLRKEAMGFGDVKLLTMIGFLLGWELTLLTIVFSSFAGVAFYAFRRKKRFAHIPYGPYLALGAFVSMLWGHSLINWYLGQILF